MNPENALKDFMAACQTRAEAALDARLPGENILPARLHQAMRYSVLGGGKRMRPMLAYATGKTLGLAPELLDGPACAVEFIHVYSLIHDDLPAMDDDSLRRGKPTCHIAYDEATAILAGDALQTLAFAVLAEPLPGTVGTADTQLRLIQLLAEASGARGMVRGQAMDLQAVNQSLDLSQLEQMHRHKT